MESSNIISRRGPAVLKKLLRLEATWDHKSVPDKDVLHKIVDFISTRDESDLNLELNTPAPSFDSSSSFQAANSSSTYTETGFLQDQQMEEDVFEHIFAHAAFDQTEFEMELFENPFDFADSMM